MVSSQLKSVVLVFSRPCLRSYDYYIHNEMVRELHTIIQLSSSQYQPFCNPDYLFMFLSTAPHHMSQGQVHLGLLRRILLFKNLKTVIDCAFLLMLFEAKMSSLISKYISQGQDCCLSLLKKLFFDCYQPSTDSLLKIFC